MVFLSSGHIVADRRFEFARELAARGDHAAAADLYEQATELAPQFASAWFALGETRLMLGDRAAAVAAFRQAQLADAKDRHGAALQLARLDAGPVATPTPHYVSSLFDDYAARFDTALVDRLGYRGPALLLAAVTRAGRHFRTAIDLGCGTGLGGAAFRPLCDRLIGVDLSPRMIDKARGKGLYDALQVADITAFLDLQPARTADLIIAADVFVYLAGLAPVLAAAARVLAVDGLIGFSVETHAGSGVIVGEALRFAHGTDAVRAAVAAAGLTLVSLQPASTRNDAGVPVPGLIVIARRAKTSS